MACVDPTLSVVIITFNEEKNILECIRSLGHVDEVIVVDSGSTDRTLELAKTMGARVVRHQMKDFATQRNFADSLATCDWLFSIDADERMTPELQAEIASAMMANSHSGYLVPELNVVFGRELRHGGWYPQYHLRLIRRGAGSWAGDVMERVRVDNRELGTLKSALLHYGHPDINTFVFKLNRYSGFEARRLEARSRGVLGLLAIAVPVPYFLYKYVAQAGFRDGWRGFVVAMLLAYYRSLVYLKAIELRRSHPNESP